jgi:hypothetical protein
MSILPSFVLFDFSLSDCNPPAPSLAFQLHPPGRSRSQQGGLLNPQGGKSHLVPFEEGLELVPNPVGYLSKLSLIRPGWLMRRISPHHCLLSAGPSACCLPPPLIVCPDWLLHCRLRLSLHQWAGDAHPIGLMSAALPEPSPGNTGLACLWIDVGRRGTQGEGGNKQDWRMRRADNAVHDRNTIFEVVSCTW